MFRKMRRFGQQISEEKCIEILKNEKQVHELPLLVAFQGRFLKAYPECRDVYKAIQRMDAYERKHSKK